MRGSMKQKIKYGIVSIFFLCFLCIPFICEFASAAPSGGYKLVNFRTKSSDTINTHYIEAVTGEQGYTNGYYGADALYLGTENGKVKFMLSGVVGYADSWEVELLPMETQADYDKYYMSFYESVNGIITHKIAKTIYGSSYSSLPLGPDNIGLEEGKDYLSYDGHYFYLASLEGYKQMADDIINGTHDHAVNAGRPYYSYYQFLSHRSKTNYTAADIANYITNVWGYTSTVQDRYNIKNYESLLYGTQDSFISAQNKFGANALLSFGVATNESNYGTSSIALRTNNLYGHGAYDEAPGANANGYNTPQDGINAHAEFFISIGYMDPNDYQARYNGGQLGNKASGFNVKYASDPYWGEKGAYQYFAFDRTYGYQDYGYYTLGIKTSSNNYTIYKEPDTNSNALYTTTNVTDYSVIILGEVTGSSVNGNSKWYKIQADPVLNSNRTAFVQDVGEYNFANNYAYIHSSAIDVIVENGVGRVNTTYNITFNANGGLFSDQTSSKTVNVQSGVIPTMVNPTREGYDFIGWNETITPATGNKTYTAQWKAKEYNITFDANGGTFKDGNTKRVVKTTYNQKPVVDEPTKKNYIFKGWEPEVVVATSETTYKAIWEEAVFHDVTFNADGGTFSNGKEELVVETAEGTIPSVETPFKDGYVFVGWTPELTETTGPTSYEAIWKEGTVEDYLTEKDGNFYFNYLKEVNDELNLQGYQTILGIDNNLEEDIQYQIVFKNIENGEEKRVLASRIMDEEDIPNIVYSPDGKDYSYSWFNATIDLNQLDLGNYQMYIVAYNDQYYAKSIVNNKARNTQATNYESENHVATIYNNYDKQTSFVEIDVRDEVVVPRTSSFIYNQYDKYVTFEFNQQGKLHIRGNAYSYGMNLSPTSTVKRYLIFENKDTYQSVVREIGSITDGDHKAVLPVSDNLDKTRAWFDATIDVSDMEEGEYVLYIATSANINDMNKMTEKLGRSLDKVKLTMYGKKYSFTINKNFGNRIEMKVEKVTSEG